MTEPQAERMIHALQAIFFLLLCLLGIVGYLGAPNKDPPSDTVFAVMILCVGIAATIALVKSL